MPSYLYVLYPVLQEDLNTTSHSTEQLIEKRQILNSVLIQQVSQPWKFSTESQRSEVKLLLYFKDAVWSQTVRIVRYQMLQLLIYKVFTVAYLFAK